MVAVAAVAAAAAAAAVEAADQAGGAEAVAAAAAAAAAVEAADQGGEGVATSGGWPQRVLVALRIQGPSESWDPGVAWPMMPGGEGRGESSCPCAWRGSR